MDPINFPHIYVSIFLPENQPDPSWFSDSPSEALADATQVELAMVEAGLGWPKGGPTCGSWAVGYDEKMSVSLVLKVG